MTTIQVAAEEAVIIYLAEQPDEHVLGKIRLLSEKITDTLGPLIIDLVPSFTSLTVYYDICAIDYHSLRGKLLPIIAQVMASVHTETSSRNVEIPVYYGDEVASDTARISELTGLSQQQIITLHTQHPVRVFALGFRPGFGFMGTLPEELRVPRMDTPRQRVPKGAVAVAEGQTAVYPDISPGGWNIIGRCPIAMFDRSGGEPTTFLQVGDRVCFKSISRDEFLCLGGELSVGELSVGTLSVGELSGGESSA